ncbi:Uncharacterized protein HZ326_11860 [Fusarium oxysporum f. sp. albedinis]|nr:Uncharacterized protein HZ326_11860 [Fusarium oxysporum f. sp. albedinis]
MAAVREYLSLLNPCFDIPETLYHTLWQGAKPYLYVPSGTTEQPSAQAASSPSSPDQRHDHSSREAPLLVLAACWRSRSLADRDIAHRPTFPTPRRQARSETR